MRALETARVGRAGGDEELGLELLAAVRADDALRRLGGPLGNEPKLAAAEARLTTGHA